jgi:hypothetical protein
LLTAKYGSRSQGLSWCGIPESNWSPQFGKLIY